MPSKDFSQQRSTAAALRARAAKLCQQIKSPQKLAAHCCQRSAELSNQALQVTREAEELRIRSQKLRQRVQASRTQLHQIDQDLPPQTSRSAASYQEPANQSQGQGVIKVGADNERVAFNYRGHVIYMANTLQGWKPMVDHWILPMRPTLGEATWLACTFVDHAQVCNSVGQVLTEMFESRTLSQEECLNLLSSLHESIGP
ncbi:hypothetical protein H6F94_04085 [Leptolyngbya sp. FACHB-261]|nr:hypothetical protein [Leptolyngbya sp. FACHB-261]